MDPFNWSMRPGTDNGARHRLLVQQPGDRDIGWLLAEVGAEFLIGFKSRAVLIRVFLHSLVGAPPDPCRS
jgi:hypothetical protein